MSIVCQAMGKAPGESQGMWMMQTEKPASHRPKASAFSQRSFCSKYLYDRGEVILNFQISMRESGKRDRKMKSPAIRPSSSELWLICLPTSPPLHEHQTRSSTLLSCSPSPLSEAQRPGYRLSLGPSALLSGGPLLHPLPFHYCPS